jgi:hypothetical protein
MLYTSEGLTFGLRPNALGLRSEPNYRDNRDRVKRRVVLIGKIELIKGFDSF